MAGAQAGLHRAIAHKQPDELRVSLADKLHNARAILLDFRTHGDMLWDRFKAGEGESVRWYYRSLYQAFAARHDALGDRAIPVLDELGRTVAEIDRLAGGGARHVSAHAPSVSSSSRAERPPMPSLNSRML